MKKIVIYILLNLFNIQNLLEIALCRDFGRKKVWGTNFPHICYIKL